MQRVPVSFLIWLHIRRLLASLQPAAFGDVLSRGEVADGTAKASSSGRVAFLSSSMASGNVAYPARAGPFWRGELAGAISWPPIILSTSPGLSGGAIAAASEPSRIELSTGGRESFLKDSPSGPVPSNVTRTSGAGRGPGAVRCALLERPRAPPDAAGAGRFCVSLVRCGAHAGSGQDQPWVYSLRSTTGLAPRSASFAAISSAATQPVSFSAAA